MSRTPNIEHASSADGYNVRRPEEVREPGDRGYRSEPRYYDGDDYQLYRDEPRGRRGDGHSTDFLTHFNPFNAFQRMMDGMRGFFGGEGSLFGNMDKMFEDAARSPEGTHYVSSTSMCMLPGGVKEVKQRVISNGKDVETHTRAIGDRYISNKRERDIKTGREDVSRDLYDIKEHEIDSFGREFDEHMSKMPKRDLFDWGRPNALLGDRYSGPDNSRALRDRSGGDRGDYDNANRYDRRHDNRYDDYGRGGARGSNAGRGYAGRDTDRDADRMRLSGTNGRRY